MCCFSVAPPSGLLGKLFAKKVQVSSTKIFGRMIANGVQGLAYSMNLSTKNEVAMVLPLPIRPGGGDRSLRFIDLSHRARMFDDLAGLFETPEMVSRRQSQSQLAVHKVGSFIASFVPTIDDFDRLDRRFRMPDVLFDAVPAYRDYGFAVFQLAPGETTVHPMGIRFATKELERIYFPTVHLHDGTWHDTAWFDHVLYYQHPEVKVTGGTFEGDDVGLILPSHSYGTLLDPHRPVVRRPLVGELPNADTFIRVKETTGLYTT